MDLQQSNSLEIEMPFEERKRVTTVIANWQFSTFNDDGHTITLFLHSSETYIKNLISRKETPIIKEEYRGKVPENTILHQSFTCFFRKADGRQEEPILCDGELIIIHLKYKGLKFLLKFNENSYEDGDLLLAKFLLSEGPGVDPILKTTRFEKDGEGWSYIVDEQDFSTYLKNRLALEILFQKEVQRDQKFAGIKNNGCTCYMNSILQILFFLRPLRKAVVEYKGEGKTILALREVFLNLMNEPLGSKRPIDAEDLIVAYGRFSEQPRRQQDCHEFLLGFLQELEGDFPTLAQLWQGQCRQIIQSSEENKPYKSDVKQEFSGLDLPLQDLKGNTYGELIDSLGCLLKDENVDEKIDNQDYGKLSVVKRRQFLHLPPILFLTLKRYEYKKNSTRPTKILADLHYPLNINLGFLMGTPTGEDMEYQLFAVTVHKGSTYNSGHYYSFINTSFEEGSPLWLKFDDSRVFLSSIGQIQSFSGGKRKTMSWNKQFERFLEREYKDQNTAYILAYFKKQVFQQYQQIECPIPQDWISKKRKVNAQERLIEKSASEIVEVCIMDAKQDFDIFGDVQTIPVDLDPNEDIVTQLKKADYNLLGCKVGTVWKVSKQDPKPKIKRLIQFSDLPQTPSRVFSSKRGHRKVDYLLIVPSDIEPYRNTSIFQADKLGLVRVTIMSEEFSFRTFSKLIHKDALQDFISEEQKSAGKKANIQIFDKQQFELDWNDCLCMVIE